MSMFSDQATPRFAGRAVIVTGAASGLGRATALAFGAAGADVLLCDIDPAGLENAAAALENTRGRHAVLPADITDAGNCAAVVTRAMDEFGRLDGLINVAGAFHLNPLAATTAEAWDRVFAVNARAPFLLAQAAMSHLIEADGAIVNVASSSAMFGHAYLTAYGASKAALVSLTKSLAMEFMHTRVRINAIAPGGMTTPMTLGMTGFPDGIDRTLM